MATTKKGASKKGASKKGTAKNVSMTKEDKNPSGGLTDKGRAKLKAAGQNIKPGVTKKDADLTPEEMQRKGAFLRRHYANPRSALTDAKGEPTRFALQAQAWGERIPKTEEDVRKLADKGTKLLDRYHKQQGDGKASAKSAGKASGKTATKKSGASKSAKKSAGKTSSKKSSTSASDKQASTTAKTNTGENH